MHGRTRACKFLGQAEYETIKQIKAAVSIPVIANGDINSLTKAREVLAYTKADAVMIGRAAFGRPWLLGMIGQALLNEAKSKAGASLGMTEPTLETQAETLLEHMQGLYALYGTNHGCSHCS